MNRSNINLIRQANEPGMTLIEVMVSLVILAVVLVGLGEGIIYGIRINNDSKTKISSLNMCKRIMEDLKSQIARTQAAFDSTASSTRTYYVDGNDNEIAAGNGAVAFQVNVIITNWTDSSGHPLSQTIVGVTSVLVKTLEVRVVDVQNLVQSANANGNSNTSLTSRPGREIKMKVELVRPAATT